MLKNLICLQQHVFYVFSLCQSIQIVLHIFLICYIHVHFTQRVWTFNGIKKGIVFRLGVHIISRIPSPYIKSQLYYSLYNLFLACVGVLDRR